MDKKKVGIIIGVIAVAAAAAAGLWYFLSNGVKDSDDRVYVERVSTIMGKDSGNQNRYSGIVEPQKTLEINTDSERTVKEILVAVGDAVEEGTPLFSYDTDDLEMELAQAKLELENVAVDISNYNTQIAELKKERDSAAEGDKFEYTTQIQTLQTNIKQSEFERKSKDLEMEKIQKKIDNSQVLSTMSGVVKTINNNSGTQDSADSSSAFMTILATGNFRIKGKINEQNIGTVVPGVSVLVRSRVDESITWKGMIESIDTESKSSNDSESDMDYIGGGMDEGSENKGTNYPFYVTLENTDGLLLGQHVLIELDAGQEEEKEGVWLYSNYIVFGENDENRPDYLTGGTGADLTDGGFMEGTESLAGTVGSFTMGTESMMPGTEAFTDIPQTLPEDAGFIPDNTDTGYEALEGSTESETSTEPAPEGAFVWADDGKGRLEKRPVELGEYDPDLDEFEILSGLTDDDKIAWPIPGLYEGIQTVTSTDDIDYSSGLYQNGDTEEGTEFDMPYEDGEYSTEGFIDGGGFTDDGTTGGAESIDGGSTERPQELAPKQIPGGVGRVEEAGESYAEVPA